MNVVAVMPAYLEAPRIGEAVLGIRTLVDQIVVVDDGSGDGTTEEARRAGAVVLAHAINRGQGASLKTGTEAALKLGADIILHVDADGQHDPSTIPALIDAVCSGTVDVAFGSRFLGVTSEGMTVSRKALLALARRFSTLVLGLPWRLTDPQSGLRAMTADAARRIDFRQDRFAHCSEILRLVTRSDLRWVEVPTRIRYTADTLEKGQKPTDALKIVWQLFLGALQD